MRILLMSTIDLMSTPYFSDNLYIFLYSLASKIHPIGGKIAYYLGWTPWNLFDLEAVKVCIEKEKGTFETDDTQEQDGV